MKITDLILLLSLSANFYFLYKFKFEVKKDLTMEAKDLLAELMSGSAIVKVDVIDKAAIFLRSPKDL